MKICLITRFHSQHLQSSFAQRMSTEAQAAGHSLTFINPRDLTFAPAAPTGGACPIYWQNMPFPEFDLIHYALRWDDAHGWQAIESLNHWGYPLLPPQRVPLGDSVTMKRLFERAGVRTPRTWVTANASQLQVVIGEMAFPCVFRVRKGAQGRRLYQANHSGEAMQIAEALTHNGFPFMVQEILPPTGVDVRVFATTEKIIAAVERFAPVTYYRPAEEGNLRLQTATLSAAEEELVKTALRIYNAPYAAVSFLRLPDSSTPVLLELARAPTLSEVESTTGHNVAGELISYLANAATRFSKTTPVGHSAVI